VNVTYVKSELKPVTFYMLTRLCETYILRVKKNVRYA